MSPLEKTSARMACPFIDVEPIDVGAQIIRQAFQLPTLSVTLRFLASGTFLYTVGDAVSPKPPSAGRSEECALH